MMTRVARAWWCLILVSGCGGPAPATTDAGTDAGPRADAWAGDASMPLACGGLATVCATLMTATECATVEGCAFSQCGGFAIACEERLSAARCGNQGCSWDGSRCTGTAVACGGLAMDICPMQAGCAWSAGMPRCRGSATGCETLTAATCTSQPGCRTCDDFGCRVPLGIPCAVDTDCNMPWGGVCVTDFPDGYCAQTCGTASTACPPTATCVDPGTGAMICLGNCTTPADCRTGYACTMVSATLSVCTGP